MASSAPCSVAPLDAMRTASACWGFAVQAQALWWTNTHDAARVRQLQQQRLAELIDHARRHSPLYARLYRRQPSRIPPQRLHSLPVVRRSMLMRHFDEWVTDREVRLQAVQRFIADIGRVGEPHLGRHAVWTSSGSTGEPGIYVQDEAAMALYEALGAVRMAGAAPAARHRALGAGGLRVLITATGGHFAGIVSWLRARRAYPWLAPFMRTLSVLQPIDQVVAQLNRWQPSEVASYPSMLALLAQEQQSGRLHLQPRALWSGGENLDAAVRDRIVQTFGCPVVDAYGASECMGIAFECSHGGLHLNEDWVLLEPVDAGGRPVPPGQTSHTVLLSNLANRLQPLIRYDLGDRITWLPPCPCGSALTAIRVDGRSDDTVRLTPRDGAQVSLLPLALTTVVEDSAGVHRFQLRQTGPRALSLSLDDPSARGRQGAWRRIREALSEHLAKQGLRAVRITLSARPPQADPRTGKLRRVVGLRSD